MKTSLAAFGRGKNLRAGVIMTLLRAHKLEQNSRGLDKILQARFSSSTWKVSELTIRRLLYKFIVDARAAARWGKKHSPQYQE